MLSTVRAILVLISLRFRSRVSLEPEVLALRHQLAVLRRQRPGRPWLFRVDRLFWVCLYRLWPRCLKAMVLVKPATVVQWHRQGFRLYWRWRSRTRRSGRPKVDRAVRELIRQMNAANPLWGAPRIHGEMLKLGIEVSQATVRRYMIRRPNSPSPTWRTFLRNQIEGIAAIDMFVVATAAFRLRSYGRCFSERVEAMGISEVITAPQSPWQNPYVERVIGSIRRECLDHIVVVNERHLRRVLSQYVNYYDRSRTHLSLDKDCPESRPVQPPALGRILAVPQVGGLHHRYERVAA